MKYLLLVSVICFSASQIYGYKRSDNLHLANKTSVGAFEHVNVSISFDLNSILVNRLITIGDSLPVLNPIGPFCEMDAQVVLSTVQNGFTGIWSGVGVNANIFDPSIGSGNSPYTLTFTPDTGQCAIPNTLEVMVNPAVIAILSPIGPFCETNAPVMLNVFQDGILGSWSGPGISENQFDPMSAGSTGSPHTLTFTPDTGQCAVINTIEVIVLQMVSPILNQLGPFCELGMQVPLATTQDGIIGNWSGPGVAANNFDPMSAGSSGSPHTLTFTPNIGQCASSNSIFVEVIAALLPTLDSIGPFCNSDSAVLLNTIQDGIFGNWSGVGVLDNNFYPFLAGSGLSTLIFTPNSGECAEENTIQVLVEGCLMQTYTTLNPSQEVFFLSGFINLGPYGYKAYRFSEQDTMLQGYRIDSVALTVQGEKINFFNTIKRDFFNINSRTPAAWLCDTSHWMGTSMTSNAAGLNIYYNGVDESLTYKTDAIPGESWLFYSRDTIGEFYATMDSTVIVDTIFGVVDEIYSISLQLFSVQGDSLDHTLNGRKILVGKNNGFIETIDHYHFPNDTNWYRMCGLTYPRIGITMPQLKDIYDFNVGDEYHYRTTNTEYIYPNPFPTAVTSYSIIEIDSIFFEGPIKNYVSKQPYCEDDTLKFLTKFISIDTTVIYNSLPLEQNHKVYYENGKIIVDFDCATPALYDSIGVQEKCQYCSTDDWNAFQQLTTGLGQISESYGIQNDFYYESNLIYYKKGIAQVGDSLTWPDCFVGVDQFKVKSEVHVFPNPVSDYLTIQSTSVINSLKLFDVGGRLIWSADNISNAQVEINMSGNATGVYLLQIILDEGVVVERVVLE